MRFHKLKILIVLLSYIIYKVFLYIVFNFRRFRNGRAIIIKYKAFILKMKNVKIVGNRTCSNSLERNRGMCKSSEQESKLKETDLKKNPT